MPEPRRQSRVEQAGGQVGGEEPGDARAEPQTRHARRGRAYGVGIWYLVNLLGDTDSKSWQRSY